MQGRAGERKPEGDVRRKARLVWALAVVACGPGDSVVQAERWTVEPDLRIGAVDDPLYGLGQVLGLAVGPGGEMLVAEWREGALRVFDAEGRYVRRIGRSGAGPGESSQPMAPTFRGDTLFVADPFQRRLHRFTREGGLLETIAPVVKPLSDVLGAPTPGVPLADGTLLSRPAIRADLIGTVVREAPAVRMSRSGEILDTILMLPQTNGSLTVRYADGAYSTRAPITDEPLFGVTSDGSAVVLVTREAATSGTASTFRVTKLSIGRDTLFSRAYEYAPVPLAGANGDSLVNELARRIASSGRVTIAQAEEATRRAIFLPRFRPPVSELQMGRDGTTWLRREEGDGPDVEWNVLDEDGQLIARVALPRVLRVYAADREHVWGVVKDELDVDYVVRYRVMRAAR